MWRRETDGPGTQKSLTVFNSAVKVKRQRIIAYGRHYAGNVAGLQRKSIFDKLLSLLTNS